MSSKNSVFAYGKFENFTSGNNLYTIGFNLSGLYFYNTLTYGAQLGSANYANISFDGNHSIYEAVGQFYSTEQAADT
jgi:hypothetical protein